MERVRIFRPSGRRARRPPRGSVSCEGLVVFGIGLLDLLDDLAEVVALRCLQRRELLLSEQVPEPQLLADRQQVPVVQEGS